jgi:hypothetical protein
VQDGLNRSDCLWTSSPTAGSSACSVTASASPGYQSGLAPLVRAPGVLGRAREGAAGPRSKGRHRGGPAADRRRRSACAPPTAQSLMQGCPESRRSPIWTTWSARTRTSGPRSRADARRAPRRGRHEAAGAEQKAPRHRAAQNACSRLTLDGTRLGNG